MTSAVPDTTSSSTSVTAVSAATSNVIANIELQNVTSTVNLSTPLNLKKIHLKTRNSEYNPKRFCAVILRIRKPKATALVFASGKMVCTGAKSEDESKTASKKFAKTIKAMEFPVKFKDFKV